MTYRPNWKRITIRCDYGREVELEPADAEVFHAIAQVFPDAKAVAIRTGDEIKDRRDLARE